jgi:D-threo-aldose 1-dehydrogenase
MSEWGRLGFGAANIGNLHREVDDEQAHATLTAAWDAGMRYFDTAPHYGLGLSERRLGRFLATKARDEFVLSTKVGRLLRPAREATGLLDTAHDFAVPADLERVWDFSAGGIRASHRESLERLGLDRIDVLYLHDPEKHDLDAADREAYPALIALREEGLVERVGVGSMSVDALTRAARVPQLDVLMVAGRLTLAEQPALAEVVPLAVANSIDLVVASVFNSGLLASATPTSRGRYEYGAVPPELLAKVRRIAAVCADFGVPLPVAALQYPFRFAPVVDVVIGTDRPARVLENAEWLNRSIPPELWTALAAHGLIPRPSDEGTR